MDPLYKELKHTAQEINKELIHFRRRLHRNPEVGWKEYETARAIREMLQHDGIQAQTFSDHNGLYTDIKGSNGGPTISYRADMDALPIHDEKEVPYNSRVSGFGHMCGHDVHTTIALGIAKLLNKHSNYLSGTVRIFWQPAEELSPGGALQMIKDGVLEKVDAVYALHCDPTMPSGKYRLKSGAETASFDTFKITVDAHETTHSARPHTGKDTVWIANQLAQSLYQLPGRFTDARDPAVIAICTFHGGETFNVIPRKVSFGGTIRTSWEEDRDLFREQIIAIADHAQSLYETSIKAVVNRGAPAVINDESLFKFADTVIANQIGRENTRRSRQSMGAEDFAYFSQEVPGLYLRMGTSNSPETSHPLHSSLFDIDESVIAPTAALMSFVLMQHLAQNVSATKKTKATQTE
ncbi:MAG: amidohydrolase [Balneolales bacterium]